MTAIARYLVDDLDTAVRFYADRLGFHEVRSFGPVTIVEREGLELWLSGPGSSGRNQDRFCSKRRMAAFDLETGAILIVVVIAKRESLCWSGEVCSESIGLKLSQPS